MSTQAPYGDIFQIGTPYLDQVSNRLYNEQRQRELYQQQQNKLLDDEFARNLAGIRDIDIGELTKKYGEYKLKYQNLMRKKNGGTPEEQLDVLRSKADVYKTIQGSKDIRSKELEVRKMGDKPNPNLQDDWQVRLSESMKTPIGQNTFLDYNHVYDGTQYKDATKDMQTWMGKPLIGVTGKSIAMDDKGIQYKIPTYNFASGSTGDQVLNNALIGMTKTREATKYWSLQSEKIPDEDYISTNAQYQALPQDKWNLLGKTKPTLDISKASDPLTKYAIHIAQIHELTNIPIPTGFKYETNKKASIDYNDEKTMKHIYAANNLRQSQNTLVVENEFKSQMDYAREHGGEFTPSQEVRNSFGKTISGITIAPNKFVLSPDGKTISYSGGGAEPGTVTTETYFGRMVNASGVKTTAQFPKNPSNEKDNKPKKKVKLPGE